MLSKWLVRNILQDNYEDSLIIIIIMRLKHKQWSTKDMKVARKE